MSRGNNSKYIQLNQDKYGSRYDDINALVVDASSFIVADSVGGFEAALTGVVSDASIDAVLADVDDLIVTGGTASVDVAEDLDADVEVHRDNYIVLLHYIM